MGALSRWLFLVSMLLGSALITVESLVYFDFDTLPPFIIEKLPLRFESLWRASLRVHVASALATFPLCLVLMTRVVQRRPALHRFLGRITGTGVLFVLVPSGVILAFDAKGGAPVTLGFLLSGAIVAACMVHGIRAVRGGDRVSHARAMRHVVAQMSVAVSSRALIVALDIAGVTPESAYVVALWGPVLVSAAAAELVSRRPGARSIHPIHTFRRIYSELSAFLVRSRFRPVCDPITRLGR